MGNELNTRSVTNKRLLRVAAAGGSAEDMAAAVNNTLTPEQALVRVQEVIKSRNPLELAEQKALLVIEAQYLLDSLKDDIEVGDSKARDTFVKSIRLVSDMLEKAHLDVSEFSTRLQRDQARVMGAAISLAFEKATFELMKRFPDADESEIRALMLDAIPVAVREIELNTED